MVPGAGVEPARHQTYCVLFGAQIISDKDWRVGSCSSYLPVPWFEAAPRPPPYTDFGWICRVG